MRAPPLLATLCRSPGSKVSSVAGPASTTTPPASICAVPSTTVSQVRSRTWWSPSSSPGARRMTIARAPSTVSRTDGERVPSGVSISIKFQDCTTTTILVGRICLLNQAPRQRPRHRFAWQTQRRGRMPRLCRRRDSTLRGFSATTA